MTAARVNTPHAAAIQRAMAAAPRYYAWADEIFGPHVAGRVLEVGPGGGGFTPHLLRRAAAVEALEPDAGHRAALAAAHPSLRIHPHLVEDPAVRALGPFDAVVCLNVLEHVEDDAAALANLAAVLAPGGRLCLQVPALPAIFGTMDAADGHRRRYRRAEVGRAVRAAGLEILRLGYMNLPGAFAWWFAGRVMRRTIVPAVGLYDRIIPIVRRIEAVIPPPWGQSVHCVARRPGGGA